MSINGGTYNGGVYTITGENDYIMCLDRSNEQPITLQWFFFDGDAYRSLTDSLTVGIAFAGSTAQRLRKSFYDGTAAGVVDDPIGAMMIRSCPKCCIADSYSHHFSCDG